MSNECIVDFCLHTAIKWNQARILGVASDRNHFFYNEAKVLSNKKCIPEVQQFCELLIEYRSNAAWIFDQHFIYHFGRKCSPDSSKKDKPFQKTLGKMFKKKKA